MSSETNKSSDTSSGKTINILGGQMGATEHQNQARNFNSASHIPPRTTQGSNSHVTARDYQETDMSLSEANRQQLEALLIQLSEIADDYPDIGVRELAYEAVQEAIVAKPDVKQVAIYTETLKQAAENVRSIAGPVTILALSIVRLLEENF
jgi:hypothetical protein